MAVNTGDFWRIEIVQEQYLQAVTTRLDYRVVNANAVDTAELANDFVSHWRSWILSWQTQDLHGVRYRFRRYGTLLAPAAGGISLRPRFAENYVVDAVPGTDDGQKNEAPLPTYATASARKVGGGSTRSFNASGAVADFSPDVKFVGRIGVGGLTEDQTQDGQGNKLAVVTGANWLNTWRQSMEQIRALNFRFGTLGGTYQLQMQVRSDYGPGGGGGSPTPRTIGGQGAIVFRDVSSISVSQFLGSQLTRKQVEKFQ